MLLRAGVIGVGFMGSLHCKAYSSLDDVKLVGVFDLDKSKAEEIAKKFNTNSFNDIEELLNNIDVVSIAVPTILHYDICLLCILNNKHMLIEKPIVASMEQAVDLISRIEKTSLTACVGYIERFNPVVVELQKVLNGSKIIKIETKRIALPVDRANDVSVIFDLMIHDIDIALSLKNALPKKVEAIGEKINSKVYNRATAQLYFDDGTRVILFSDKNANEKLRKINVVCSDFVVDADLINKTITHSKLGKYAVKESVEPIILEVKNFVESVKKLAKPVVSAKDSLRAFHTAWDIEENLVVNTI